MLGNEQQEQNGFMPERNLTHARISASNAETFGSPDEPGFIFGESLEIDCSPSRILLSDEKEERKKKRHGLDR